jgi:hypothetical protein
MSVEIPFQGEGNFSDHIGIHIQNTESGLIEALLDLVMRLRIKDV